MWRYLLFFGTLSIDCNTSNPSSEESEETDQLAVVPVQATEHSGSLASSGDGMTPPLAS
jgi:hypothetical protein